MIQDLPVADLAAGLEARSVVLLDVRPVEDVAAGHIPGSWPVALAVLPLRLRDVDDPLQVRLRTSAALVALVAGDEGRLAAARALLAEIGVEAVGVTGEVVAWSRAGRPLNRGRIDVEDPAERMGRPTVDG
ncbi:hypothetical protein Acsp06_45370 [Actinomycetospora sp. NBRC 106375]|uniref:rhodanese-like domain-containing protein n=1 Tax=Actinomycetospora sp. NBRC 106375 TaxID=3032207 RepID=UPI0024A010B2|nr:rhodanese-like domain-containing protein [Actinomycetospora sp. NBRC 106375]GLZ48352.1 hypothetical protein Acsp06_45370 [Actinomycetospora sp. NBRC 106375]